MVRLDNYDNRNFNPRSYTRSDIYENIKVLNGILFQSSLLHEERLQDPNNPWRIRHFNPRSYTRSDWQSEIMRDSKLISIHAPTRGATS